MNRVKLPFSNEIHKKSYFTLQRIRKSNWKTINCGIGWFTLLSGANNTELVNSFLHWVLFSTLLCSLFFALACEWLRDKFILNALFWIEGVILTKTTEEKKIAAPASLVFGLCLEYYTLHSISHSQSWISCFVCLFDLFCVFFLLFFLKNDLKIKWPFTI